MPCIMGADASMFSFNVTWTYPQPCSILLLQQYVLGECVQNCGYNIKHMVFFFVNRYCMKCRPGNVFTLVSVSGFFKLSGLLSGSGSISPSNLLNRMMSLSVVVYKSPNSNLLLKKSSWGWKGISATISQTAGCTFAMSSWLRSNSKSGGVIQSETTVTGKCETAVAAAVCKGLQREVILIHCSSC